MNNTEEYPIHIKPEWTARENIKILDEITNDKVYTYNFYKLPEEMQNEIIKILAYNLADYIK